MSLLLTPREANNVKSSKVILHCTLFSFYSTQLCIICTAFISLPLLMFEIFCIQNFTVALIAASCSISSCLELDFFRDNFKIHVALFKITRVLPCIFFFYKYCKYSISVASTFTELGKQPKSTYAWMLHFLKHQWKLNDLIFNTMP